MKVYSIEDFKGGWFIGNFLPSIIRTELFEAGLKKYKKGDVDRLHYHKQAIEITLILSGEASFSGKRVNAGELAVLEPGEKNQFSALSDVQLLVIKFPSIPDDKYFL